jgi:xanthine dehydrogenase accessory factor
MRKIYLKLAGFEGDLSGLVLATVISASGSTPAKAGSAAIFDKNGLLTGTVGGGVLEGRVTSLALEYLHTGNSAIHNFEFNKDITNKDEAICGGRASVLIDSQLAGQRELFCQIRDHLLKRMTIILATSVRNSGNGSQIVERKLYRENDKDIPEVGKTPGLILLEKISPPKQLIIAGAGHIGKCLCHLGSLLDFEVTVIDDRPEFANHNNLPEAERIIVGDIGAETERIGKDSDTYVVIVTRGHNDDAKALRACIGSTTAYIGMIGSRTKIEKMKISFIENGWTTPDKWASIHAPVGLKIGSDTIEEIAVSIAAELVMVRNQSGK